MIRRLIRRRSDADDEDLPLHDDSVPLPPGAEEELRPDHPRLQDLRERYAKLDLPVTTGSRWSDTAIDGFLDLKHFRGETLFMWHYREAPRVTALKYFVFASYIRERDDHGLLDRLTEDGAFGCWRFDYPGHGTYSRDLLESVNELTFLDRHLDLTSGLRILDIGAGYGRLAHRLTEAFPATEDYACIDAVPEATFVSDYYLRFRQAAPPARVVPLDRLDDLQPQSFDLAVNIHSFSECTHAAVAFWVEQLQRLQVPNVLVIPNEPAELLTLEPDGTRRDFGHLLHEAGYERTHEEPVLDDPAVRDLVRIDDHFHLFALRGR